MNKIKIKKKKEWSKRGPDVHERGREKSMKKTHTWVLEIVQLEF
jgi:hypothetical protein